MPLFTGLESFGQILRQTGLDMYLEDIFNPPIQEEPAGIVRSMGSHFNGALEDKKITDEQHDVELLQNMCPFCDSNHLGAYS